jgi:hypothetical protein
VLPGGTVRVSCGPFWNTLTRKSGDGRLVTLPTVAVAVKA